MKLTPRSHEALKRSGLTVDDLLIKTPEEINAKYGDVVTDKQLLEKRVGHHEEKRRSRIDQLKQMREQVVDE